MASIQYKSYGFLVIKRKSFMLFCKKHCDFGGLSHMPRFENRWSEAVVVSVYHTHCQAEQDSRDMEEYFVDFIFFAEGKSVYL